MARGLGEADSAYRKQQKERLGEGSDKTRTIILFVIQPGERNAVDQRLIEYSLIQHYQVPSVRLSLDQIEGETTIEPNSRALIHKQSGLEISVIYFRSGYAPSDYKGDKEWDARLYLETSSAIKCPSIITQLSGAKKIQQILTDPSLIQKYISDQGEPSYKAVLETFVKIYPLDESVEGLQARKLALDSPRNYVLKPQREGGGNNVYREDIPGFLASIPKDSWSGYILMELITPPNRYNSILRAGELYQGEVVSELGIFGTILWDSTDASNPVSNQNAGWLLRTKLQSSDEGGVAAGFGCIDSVYLVDE